MNFRQLASLLVISLLVHGCTKAEAPTDETTNVPHSQTLPEVTYTMDEVAKHASEKDCWLVIEGGVYDVSEFVPSHPGGKEILHGCGKDATSMFEAEKEHQEHNAAAFLPEYQIGNLE